MIVPFSRPLLLLFLVVPWLASAQDRLALVVGIDRYDQVADLQKATNDARAISDALATVGFDVTALTDVDERSFNRGLDRFISDVKPGDEVVFFFAGHGVEIDGRNYLLPSDAPSGASERTIRAESILADQVLSDIQSAGASVAVMILDACRDNPYAGGGRSVGGARGLSIVAAPEGSFVLLSAASGEVAFEGDDSDPNSIFTRALLPLLQEPGLPLPNLARRLRNDVERLASASGKTQRPAYYDEVTGEFMFVRGAASQQAAPAGDPCSRARTDWQYVDGSGDTRLLESYIAEHDDCGLFTRLAAQQLALLVQQGLSETVDRSKVSPPQPSEQYNIPEVTAAYHACSKLADPEIVHSGELPASDFADAERACRTALASGLEERSEQYLTAVAFLERFLSEKEKLSDGTTAEGNARFNINNLNVMHGSENGPSLQFDDIESLYDYIIDAMQHGDSGVFLDIARQINPSNDQDNQRRFIQKLRNSYELWRAVEERNTAEIEIPSLGEDLYFSALTQPTTSQTTFACEQFSVLTEVLYGTRYIDELFPYFYDCARIGNTSDADLLLRVGNHLVDGDRDTRDLARGLEILQIAAANGSGAAYYSLGMVHQFGKGVESDLSRAISLFKSSATLNYGPAYTTLGAIFESGAGGFVPVGEISDMYLAGLIYGDMYLIEGFSELNLFLKAQLRVGLERRLSYEAGNLLPDQLERLTTLQKLM